MIIMRLGRGARGPGPLFVRGAVCNEPLKTSEPVLYLSFRFATLSHVTTWPVTILTRSFTCSLAS